jgi:hypothetical protein
MANQDPQPEIYTTRHTFAAAAAANTSVQQQIFTNQANNEEVRLYALAISIEDNAGDAIATGVEVDFAVTIGVGPNNVPSNQFDVGWLNECIRNGGGVLAFPCPVLVLFQQPLSITVTWMGGTTSAALVNARNVVITLISELAIQKLPEIE